MLFVFCVTCSETDATNSVDRSHSNELVYLLLFYAKRVKDGAKDTHMSIKLDGRRSDVGRKTTKNNAKDKKNC